MSDSRPITILCIASEPKGLSFITEGKRQGCRMLVLTQEKYRDGDWPRESIDEFFVVPDIYNRKFVVNSVSYLARSREIDLISPLDDFDVEMTAFLRAHLSLPA